MGVGQGRRGDDHVVNANDEAGAAKVKPDLGVNRRDFLVKRQDENGIQKLVEKILPVSALVISPRAMRSVKHFRYRDGRNVQRLIVANGKVRNPNPPALCFNDYAAIEDKCHLT